MNNQQESLGWRKRIDQFLEENGTDLSIHGAWLPDQLKSLFENLLASQRQQIVGEVSNIEPKVTIEEYIPLVKVKNLDEMFDFGAYKMKQAILLTIKSKE